MYFETKVRYEKTLDSGKRKRVTEPYLVDALTCTEAEARITEKLSGLYPDFDVVGVKQSKLCEIVRTEADYYYLVKTNYPTIDERTGQEKSNVCSTLVQAPDLNVAKLAFEDYMAESMADWEYVSISLTPIVEVFSLQSKE